MSHEHEKCRTKETKLIKAAKRFFLICFGPLRTDCFKMLYNTDIYDSKRNLKFSQNCMWQMCSVALPAAHVCRSHQNLQNNRAILMQNLKTVDVDLWT